MRTENFSAEKQAGLSGVTFEAAMRLERVDQPLARSNLPELALTFQKLESPLINGWAVRPPKSNEDSGSNKPYDASVGKWNPKLPTRGR